MFKLIVRAGVVAIVGATGVGIVYAVKCARDKNRKPIKISE